MMINDYPMDTVEWRRPLPLNENGPTKNPCGLKGRRMIAQGKATPPRRSDTLRMR